MRRDALPIVLLVAIAMALYALLGLGRPVPSVFPDEFLYGHLARSLADGDGFTWRGADQPLRAALYVYAIAPAWLVASGTGAFHLARLESAILCCLLVVPVWRLARTLLSPRLALAACTLCLSGTWMVVSAGILTENLALPLATASLTATVFALREPGSRASWWAIAFALLATWARFQLVVLIPIVIGAHLVDVARAGGAWRSRLREHVRLLAFGAALLVVALIALIAADDKVAGLYADVLHFSPSPGSVLKKTGLQLIQLVVMSGFLPVLLAAALALQPRAWRDESVGPLLVVFWVSALVLALEGGFFLAGLNLVPWGIERYIAYAVPLAILLAVVAFTRPDLVRARTLAIAAAASLTLLLAPRVQDVSEERAVGATIRRVHDIASGASAGISLFVVALLVCGLAALALRRSANAGVAVAAGLFVVLAAQSATAWQQANHLAGTWRTNFPSDLAWVDSHSREPVAVLELAKNALGFEQYDFFNKRITRYYASQIPPPGRALAGKVCKWQVVKGGFAEFDKACGPAPHRFFINDPLGHVTFDGESDVVTDPHAGRLVTVSGRPRLRSVVYMPCDRKAISFVPPWGDLLRADAPRQCAAGLTAYVWTHAADELVVRVKGGSEPHLAQLGSRQFEVPPGKVTTLSATIPKGGASVQFSFDWDSRGPGVPEVIGVALGGASLL